MKTIAMVCALLTLGVLQNAIGQGIQSTTPNLPHDADYAVVERGANHRVWEKTTYETTADGKIYPQKHRYTELATGLHYRQNGQWVESQEVIEPYSTGAVARQGQHQVIFANNINSAGAIDEQTPDGKRLRSNVIGLIYYDKASGNAVLIARLQDSQGQLVSANQVLYQNAFEGVHADIQYSYSRSGFEQDVILRDQLPTPESYGLVSATTELEVCTEFLSPPDASVTGTETVESGLETDENINWGATHFGQGKAFSLGSQNFAAKVAKRYTTIEGRHFLLEKVLVRDIQPALSNLPHQSSNTRRLPNLASKKLYLPKTPPLLTEARPIRLARMNRPEPGYVLDYVTINATYTNYTFQGDTTYYVTGPLYLYGTTVIEGETVIKAGLATTNVALNINGPLACNTGPYRPAVFTAKDDNTVGEYISGSSGFPSGYYGRAALYFNQAVSGVSFDLHDVRISYFGNGVIKYANPSALMGQVRNSQFCNIGSAALYGNSGDTGYFNVENVLIIKAGLAFSNSTFYVQQATLDKIGSLGGTNTAIAITNSLLVSVTNWGVSFTSVNNATNSSSSAVFQAAGAGWHYLATNSPYRSVGTTNIDRLLLADFGRKTTYPPLVCSNVAMYVATNYSPVVPRDTNTAPDLGYHYDVLDYAFGGVRAYSNLTFNAGTAVGWFELPGSGGPGYGISIYDHVLASFNGLATAPCVFARYSSVQEGGNGLWQDQGYLAGVAGQSLSGGYSMNPTNAAQAIASFTHFTALAHSPNHFREYNALLKVTANNCEFWGGSMGGYWEYYNLTNCLFDRMPLAIVGGNYALMTLRNCTMHGAYISLASAGTWPVRIENCAFDGTDLSGVGSLTGGAPYLQYCDYNAIVTNLTTLPATGGHNLTVTNYNWQSSWLGNYYLPPNSPLIDQGSATAAEMGLYQFTTQTNQVKEHITLVDIGYHYVAVDANGNPDKTYTNNVPDYLFDSNGNGLPDWWELYYFGNLNQDAAGDFAGDGYGNLYKYLNGLNPTVFINAQLGHWPFDNTNIWADSQGQPPLSFDNIAGIPSFDTNAVLVDSSNPAWLQYPYGDTNGTAHLTCRQGTVRFWFKPDWNSIVQPTNGVAFSTLPTSVSLPILASGSGLPVLTNGLMVGTNAFRFSILGAPGGNWDLYVSGDLANWSRIGSVNLTTGNIAYTNYGASNLTNQYYCLINGYRRSRVIGFERTVIAPGMNSIEDHLAAYPDTTLTNVFWNSSLPSGAMFLKLNDQPVDVYTVSGGNWSANSTVTLARDEVAFINNTTTNPFTVCFVGLVAEGTPNTSATANWSYYQSTATSAGGVQSVAGYNPNDFDMIYQWSDSGYGCTGTYLSYDGLEYYEPDWDCSSPWFNDECNFMGPWFDENLYYPNSEPSVDTGETFLIYNNTTYNPTYTWSRNAISFNNVRMGGPGSYGRMVEQGGYSSPFAQGWWAMYLTPDGSQLQFASATNGHGQVNLSAPAAFGSNQWCQIALTYTTTNSLLYINGQLVTNGPGPAYLPNLSERYNGFWIGSDASGFNQVKGAIDDFDSFNYPLSASAISSNYQATVQKDNNGNGLSDLWEWNNFGYEGVDPYGDPTGDGLSNLQKYQDNLNPHQFIPTRLGYWQFNDAPNWLDTNGLAPMVANGLYPVSSWSGDAVRLTSDLVSQLGYPGVRTNGSAVAVCPAGIGSIRFWFKPEWSSYDGNQGTGPGSNIRLFEIGRDTTNAAYGLFALSVNSLGNNITFATEANSLLTNNLTGSINFNTNSWYQLTLTYTSTNSILYLNGQTFITNGLGLTNLPSQAVLQAGFYFGSSWDGSSQANGVFDELETFNYPLSASDVATNYATIMSILASDGLPAVVANGLGLRLDAVDSTCNGLPDTWKLAHGINPNNPGPVTPQLLSLYVHDGPVGTTNVVTAPETNLINIFFSSYNTNIYEAHLAGGMVNESSSNDVWNFCTMQSDYTNNGILLTDAGGNVVNAKLFAFVGPCKTPFAAVPTPDDWETASFATDVPGLTVPIGLTYSNYINNIHEALDYCPDCHETYNLYSDPTRVGIGSTSVGGPNQTISTPVGDTSPTITGYWENIYRTNYVACGCPRVKSAQCASIWLYWVITEVSVYTVVNPDNGSRSHLGSTSPIDLYFGGSNGGSDISQVNNLESNPNSIFQGPFYRLSASIMSQILTAINSATLYNNSLITYIASNPTLVASTNTDPVALINCFLSPFSAINNNGYNLSGSSGSGAVWICPGITNAATGAGPISNIDTNGSSGAWLKKMYPDARRTLFLSGLSAGNYDVYVYYACGTNVTPAVINSAKAASGTSLSGTAYWYANVDAVSIAAPASYDDCVNASIPPWALPHATNYCIQIDVDSPNVSDSAADVRIIGLQIVGHTNAVFTSAVLQAKPGNESAYLMWRGPAAATNFSIYRSVGVSNSWTLLASTNGLNYQDVGLTVGTNYYYKVVGIETGGTAEPASGVVGVVPFGCAPPLPPRIDYVSPLQIPVVNSAYEISYHTLLTNSDAFDPEGLSMQFKVDSVSSGNLMINGQPFTLVNNIIGTNDSVVWIPPVNTPAPGTPAFRVYVADSLNRSAKTVDVKIKQRIKTYLLCWGNSFHGSQLVEGTGGCGSLGDGTATISGDVAYNMYYMFQNQNRFGVLPFDPSWQLNTSVWGQAALGDPVHRVSNIDSATSVSFFGSLQGHCAVTSDQRLWFWGGAESWALGRPMAMEYALGNVSYFGDVAINWDSSQLTYYTWGPLWLNELAPVPVNDPATQSPMTGVAAAQGLFILKTDGSLWSVGCYKPLLGRDPVASTDLFNHGILGTCGMIPGRVEIAGNDATGIQPGREIVEISAPSYVDGQYGVALARCKDGSIWAWGEMYDWSLYGAVGNNSGQEYTLRLDGADASYSVPPKPTRLLNVEAASSSPVTKICQAYNHIVLLRENGTVSELGYIPMFDPQRLVTPYMYNSEEGFYRTINMEPFTAFSVDFDSMYRTNPVVVTNVPVNVKQVCAAPSFGALLTDAGEVWVWGQWLGQILPTPQKITSLSGITKIVAGNQYIIALDKQGRLWGVGINNDGVFGFNDLSIVLGYNNGGNREWQLVDHGIFHTNAVRVAGIENVTDIFTGDNTTWSSQMYAIGAVSDGNPAGLAAVSRNQSIQLVWSNYPAASSYNIYRSLNENAGYVAIGNSTLNTFVDQSASLQNGQNYYYYVTAVVNGVETAPSWDIVATPYPPPGPVQNLTALGSCNGFKLQWQAPTNLLVSPIQSYVIMQSGVQLAELFADATNYYDDETATNTSAILYQVIARNSAGQATNSCVPVGSVPCETAPYISTNKSPSWLGVVNNGLGSDKATLVWAGPATNGNWLFEGSEFDTSAQNQALTPFVQKLFQADAVSDPLAFWLWTNFSTSATNSLLGGTASLNSNLNLVVSTLNGILTNGVGVSNLDFMVYGVTNNGRFMNGAQLRSATTNLFKTYPTGTSLVLLKRMLIDDYFGGNYFTRGGNWGDHLTGFRIHYRTLQYVNGRKLAKTYRQDVNLSSINYNHNPGYSDNEGIHSSVYGYTWLIPQGAVCWASVSAMVDGQENEISTELGPQWADTGFTWQSALRAIPGDHQVYLDWSDDVSITSYDVYYSTDSTATNTDNINPGLPSFWSKWSPVPGGTNLTMNRCWHTNLTNSTTYYYTVLANYDFSSDPYYGDYSHATVIPTNSLAQTNFSAFAAAYDGMVLVEWKVPKTNLTDPDVINQTAWQFYVERKPAGTGDTNYQLIADSGFGLAFLDSAVTDGQSYTYRVTAYDTSFNRLQTLAVDRNTGLTQSTPSAANGLTLLPPAPGNGYVDLSWSPIRATRFTIKHSLNPNGPFDVVDNLDVQSAYQNAANTYRHVGQQNGVMHYYQIAATTPTGFEIDSGVLGAMPLASLSPLPPSGFHGSLMPQATNNNILLKWNQQVGAVKYQVFLVDHASLIPLYSGSGVSCLYKVPADAIDGDSFTFDVRSLSAAGLAGDFAQTTVTNLTDLATMNSMPAVVLQVGGTSGSLTVTGPTNLALNATVNLPDIKQVSFYSDGQLIGSVSELPYVMTWYHVPGGIHTVTATALVQGNTAANFIGGGNTATFSSDSFTLTNNVEPLLSAYQTSSTDLQLPAPGLPIALSRSYTSRSTDTNAILGVGWTPAWNLGSLTLSSDLGSGWEGSVQKGFTGSSMYFISDTANHYVTVTLPGGETVNFLPQVVYDPGLGPEFYDQSGGDYTTVGMAFQGYAVNQGTLNAGIGDLDVDAANYDPAAWEGQPVQLSVSGISAFTYTTPDGTAYLYGLQRSGTMTWLLTKITDRNGNSLNYSYDSDAVNLLSISNSCGRGITFNYVPTVYGAVSGNNVEVYDTISPQGNGNMPVVVYVISNNVMTEVHQLIDRTSGIYQTNTYAYGSDQTGAPQDYNLLTDVYDARGVRMLHNDYTNSTGDLVMQTSPGRTNLFAYNAATYQLTVQTATSSATNTAMVTSDSSGAISGATVPVSGTAASTTNATQCTYDSQGNLISQTDANGNTKTYAYDSQNRLIGQSDANGNSTSSQLDAFGQPTVSTDANGNQTVYIYDNNGNPSTVKDPSGTSTSYTYNLSTLDANGNVLVGWQEASENQTIPYVPYHIVTKNNYNTPNNSTGPIYGDLTGTSQEWDDNDGHAKGPVVATTYTYDANGNRLTEVKTRTLNSGNTQTITNAYTYDAQNRVVMTVVSAGVSEILAPQTNTVTYNALGKQATSTDAAGRVTTSIYDFNGSLIETEYPDKTVSRTSYDGFGRQEYVQDRTMTNSSGASTAPATHNIYDASGRVIRADKYDAVTLTETTAGAGDYTALAGAPPQCKLVASSPGNLQTTTLTFYDAAGQVQYTVDARGAVTQNQYDGAGRRTNVLVYTAYTFAPTSAGTPNPTGAYQSTSYAYDANGNQVTVTDAAGHTTTSVYDNANRVIEVDSPSTSGGTLARKMYYDGLGRKLQETDEAGVSTAYTYDFRGLLLSVTLAAGTAQPTTTVYNYDELGNETNQVDAAGHTTVFRYDALGRRTGRMLPGGQSEGSYYDQLTGNLIYQTNFNGVVITNGYDVANRLTNSASVNGYRVSYGYNVTNGWRTNMVDPSGTTVWRYSAVGQLTNKVVAWANGPVATLNYGYDALGTLTNLWSGTASGVTNAYQYDLLGRLTNVLANGSAAAGYGFDSVGNLQTLRYGNGVTNGYQYDALNRLTNQVWKLNNTAVAGFAYTLGPTGNRTNLVETLATASRTYTWAYDYLYRLTGETISGAGTVNYGYDVVGNRTNRTSNISQLTNAVSSYTANDWLASDSYDANGSTTASSGNSYQYDALNHLTNANNGTVLMTYDGDGNRASKKVGGTTTYYLLDDRNPSGYVQVLEEWTVTSTATNLARVYNYGLNLISQRVPNSSTNYFICDGHGSTRALMDIGGNVVNTFAYDAYGTLIASNGLPQTAYLYCEQQFDSDLGLYLNRARYLNAGTGRFWTMDTYQGNTEDPLSLHKYLYCEANPVSGSDPSGLFNQKFGYRIHDAIESAYQDEHPGAIVGTKTGLLGTQFKPDILDGIDRTFMEIKPLSLSGIGKGTIQILAYQIAFSGFIPPYKRGTWPNGIRAMYVGMDQVAYFNVQGVIFYTDMTENIEKLATITTFALARQFVIQYSVQIAETLSGVMEEIPILVGARQVGIGAEMSADFGVAALETAL